MSSSATIGNWLARASDQLNIAGIETGRLDCLVILEDATGHDRSWLLAHSEYSLESGVLKKLNKQIAQRIRHLPLSYIRGRTEFYRREFIINRYVLEPRPESETMIDLLKKLPLPQKTVILDIGTGSGALAITAKLELPQNKVIATDIDKHCLQLAGRNAEAQDVNVPLLQGDLLAPLLGFIDLQHSTLLCNLPYVPESFRVNFAARHEPPRAIFGGPDGLNVYRKLFDQLKASVTKPAFVLTESLPTQHKLLGKVAKAGGYVLKEADDFIQIFELTSSPPCSHY